MSEYIRQHDHIRNILDNVTDICKKLEPYHKNSDSI